MSDPGAPSGAVAEITLTIGTGYYQLLTGPPGGPLAGYFRFADVYDDGALITIQVEDTAKKEIIKSYFDKAGNRLSRNPADLLFSPDMTLVDWPATGQRTIRPLVTGDLTVTDGITTVTNVTTIDFTVGAVVTDAGGGTADVAITGGNSNVFYISFSYGSTFQFLPSDPFDGNLEIFDLVAPTAITFPANLSTSPTPICEIAPTFNVQFNIDSYVGGVRTARGLLKYANGSTTGTYTFTAFTLPAGGRLRLYVNPLEDDGVIAGIAGTIVGTR